MAQFAVSKVEVRQLQKKGIQLALQSDGKEASMANLQRSFR